jgi:hypothetical protein
VSRQSYFLKDVVRKVPPSPLLAKRAPAVPFAHPEFHRNWYRRRRMQEVAELNRGATHCRWPMTGAGGMRTCGGVLRDDVDALGRVLTRCAWCERRWAGQCRDCERPVDGKVGQSIRCAGCRTRKRQETSTAWRKAHPRKHRKMALRWYHAHGKAKRASAAQERARQATIKRGVDSRRAKREAVAAA